jgi:flagellar protein FlaG
MIESVALSSSLNLQINKGEGLPPSPPLFSAPGSSDSRAEVQTLRRDDSVPRKSAEPVSQALQSPPSGEEANPEQAPQPDGWNQEKVKVLEESIQKINEKLMGKDREIQYKIDENTNTQYFSIVDKKTKEVISEVPPREVRKFAAALQDYLERLDTGENLRHLFINMKV